MKEFITEHRLHKIEEVIKSRQYSLHVVIENVHDSHNVSAIIRTCDAVGVPEISLLYTIEKFPKLNKITSASASKWLKANRYSSTETCFAELKKDGFKILTTAVNEKAKSIYEIDFTEKVAVVLGNEHRGASEEAISFSDEQIFIPMRGMVQSLNVSVASAVILYEAQRQRALKKLYDHSELAAEEINRLTEEWSRK